MSTNDALARLGAAITALEDVDVTALPEAALSEQITQLASILYQLDEQLSRVAEAVRGRGFSIEDVLAAESVSAA
jgi:hypothetical protein